MDVRTGYSLPRWLLFFVFLKRGTYNGSFGKIKWKRAMCWFNRHDFREFDFGDKFRLDCRDCGEQITIKKVI